MATLIPAIGVCATRMTTGERRLAERLEQARQYAHQVVNALERDPQLVQADGPHAGKLAFPWSYGVINSWY